MEININNVSFKYLKEEFILTDINLTFEEGKIYSVIGKMGSGKSTLLKLIAGELKPKSGSIIYKENDKEYKISYLSDDLENEFQYLTVKEELENVVEKDGNHTIKDKNKVEESFRLFKLKESILEEDPRSLSLAERRFISIIKILILNPKVIIIDNPQIGFNNKQCQILINVLKVIKKKYNKIIIIATNDIDFVNKISDNIILIDEKKAQAFDRLVYMRDICRDNKPNITRFEDEMAKRNKKIEYRTEINDLVKDILRNIG